MADARATPSNVPSAQQGVHYTNPSSKPLRGPVPPEDRDGVQRLVWRLFFVLVLAVGVAGLVLSVVVGRS